MNAPFRIDRSSRREVRNPILGLPAAKAMQDLSPLTRSVLRGLMLNLRDDARARADKCWRTHKAPMALYWKAVGVYANHIARALA